MVRLPKAPALAVLPAFREGLFYVQDPSTLLAVRELDPQPGESVLDLCAAPGGKTTAIGQAMRNDGRLVAYDIEPRRRERIRENCARMGVTLVRVPEGGAVRPGETFHRILIDAPCSNTGVMRRRAELRWRITEAELERLRQLQGNLLKQSSGWLKPGGTLVYSTCSLEPEENGEVVRAFLALHPGWELVKERQLAPWADGVDGAFVAVLRKPAA
jgi:16S rRNA (cytosine967-C5)-methyltransferase